METSGKMNPPAPISSFQHPAYSGNLTFLLSTTTEMVLTAENTSKCNSFELLLQKHVTIWAFYRHPDTPTHVTLSLHCSPLETCQSRVSKKLSLSFQFPIQSINFTKVHCIAIKFRQQVI